MTEVVSVKGFKAWLEKLNGSNWLSFIASAAYIVMMLLGAGMAYFFVRALPSIGSDITVAQGVTYLMVFTGLFFSTSVIMFGLVLFQIEMNYVKLNKLKFQLTGQLEEIMSEIRKNQKQ